MSKQIIELLKSFLAPRVDAKSQSWIDDQQAAIVLGNKKSLFVGFGLTPRKVGKADLNLTKQELQSAEQTRPGWDPRRWSVDQVVRTLFVLSMPSESPAAYVEILDQLFSAGEVGELVALYQALPLLPYPSAHTLRAAEGIRTNIKAVFCAVAHHNPYPAEQFTEDQWNQMVLKCQFIGVPMLTIEGLDQRANPRLASMVMDFIHERQAAKRTIAPEMWRCVGRFADQAARAELQRLLLHGAIVEQQAAALALSECTDPDARKILASAPELAKQIDQKAITWESVAQSA